MAHDIFEVNTASGEAPQAVLAQAFERFAQASSRLEEKYELLRREAEDLRAQLKLKEQRIKQTEQLATLGKAAGVIAHEVRNPLGAMKLFVSMLIEELSDRPNCITLLAHIEQSIETLNSVVSNMLQFSRAETLKRSPIHTASLICDQLQLVSAVHAGKVSFATELSDCPFILGDEQALRRVFYNLLINAVQASSGRVHLQISSRTTNGKVHIEVRDDGPGVPYRITESLFDPFITGRKEGTGLGLAVVRHIVEQHGGSIRVHNDGGAVFTLSFPAPVGKKRSRSSDQRVAKEAV